MGVSATLLVRAVAAAAVGPTPQQTMPISLSAALFAAALGITAPRRVMEWLSTLVQWLRPSFAAEAPPRAWVATEPRRDRALYWLVVAGVALAGGLGSAALILWGPRVDAMNAYMLRHYLWSILTWPLLTWTMASMKLLLPMFCVGLLARCLCRLGTVHSWTFVPVAAVLAGGWGGERLWLAIAERPHAALIAPAIASLPFFLVAVIAALTARPTPAVCGADSQQGELPAPALAARQPVLLRMCVLGVACASVALAFAAGPQSGTSQTGPTGANLSLLTLLPGCGAGIALGVLAVRMYVPTITAFALTCAAAAVATAAAALLRASATYSTPILPASVAIALGAAAWCMGSASLMVRSGQPSVIAADVLGQTCLVAAAWGLVAAPVVGAVLSPIHQITGIALTLIGLAAVLVISQPVRTEQTRRVRLATALAATVVLALTWPHVFGGPEAATAASIAETEHR